MPAALSGRPRGSCATSGWGCPILRNLGSLRTSLAMPDPYSDHSSTSQAACVLAGRNRLYAHLEFLQPCSLWPLLLAPGFKADPCHYKSKLAGCWGSPSPGGQQHKRVASFAFDLGNECVVSGVGAEVFPCKHLSLPLPGMLGLKDRTLLM